MRKEVILEQMRRAKAKKTHTIKSRNTAKGNRTRAKIKRELEKQNEEKERLEQIQRKKEEKKNSREKLKQEFSKIEDSSKIARQENKNQAIREEQIKDFEVKEQIQEETERFLKETFNNSIPTRRNKEDVEKKQDKKAKENKEDAKKEAQANKKGLSNEVTNKTGPKAIKNMPKTLKQQQEIDRRLKELNKKYKNLKYTPDTRTEEEKDWEELSKIMAKVSFNKGKTWLDILDDNDFTKIVEKVSKVKVWNAVIDSLDPDDMMKALNSMNSVSRKALNGGSVDDRVQLLGMYLKVCKDDLMV